MGNGNPGSTAGSRRSGVSSTVPFATALAFAISAIGTASPALAQMSGTTSQPIEVRTIEVTQGAGTTTMAAAPVPPGEASRTKPSPETLPKPRVGTFNEIDKLYDGYLDFKKMLSDRYNLDFSMEFSLFGQFASEGGGKPVWPVVYYPSLTWKPFTDTSFGSGQIDATTGHQTYYSRFNTGDQTARMGLITFPNDWTNDNLSVSTLAYTHTMPGSMSWLSVTAGQYNLFKFDPNAYAANAQTSFIGYSFAQDATQTFPNAGFGGYATASTPDDQFHISGGSQSAANLAGDSLRSDGRYANWGNFQWTPKIDGLGAGVYSILVYKQPFIHNISSHSTGISFSASQELTEKWGAFVRVNTASGSDLDIRHSIAAGGVMNDPFHRNPTDRVGVALAYDVTNAHAIGVEPNGSFEHETLFAGPRNHEWVSEVFYNYTVSKAIWITPDAQVFWNPALAPSRDAEAVFTVRTTLFF